MFVVMPNHFHGIILIERAESEVAAPLQESPNKAFHPGPAQGSLGAIIRAFKAFVTHRLHTNAVMRGYPIWQRNYYEHIVRNEADLQRLRDYIVANPARWVDDRVYKVYDARLE